LSPFDYSKYITDRERTDPEILAFLTPFQQQEGKGHYIFKHLKRINKCFDQ